MQLNKVGILLLLLVLIAPFAIGQSSGKKPRLIIPFGHQMGIMQTLFSHDDKMLITADEKMTIVSDVRSGKPLHYLQGNRPGINAADTLIATISDSTVMVWRADDGSLVNTLRFPSKVARIAFHPKSNLLMVERFEGDAASDNEDPHYCAAVWDVQQPAVQHEFRSTLPGGKTTGKSCSACPDNSCPIAGAWFTDRGDSLRIVHPGVVKTYALNNYQTCQEACLLLPGNQTASGTLRILNNHTIGFYNDPSANYFNEYGQWVAAWNNKGFFVELNQKKVAECISPARDYLAAYTSQAIYLYNLKAGTLKYFNVDHGHVKKLTFNKAGTHILVEFLNEAPRIMTSGFKVPAAFKPADYEGLPRYVYETKTVKEASDITGGFETASEQRPPPRQTFFGRVMKEGFGIPDPRVMVDGVMDIMVNGINIAFTNSGEIIDLATHRPVSKIQSLIKMSGDIQMSPDKNLLLLNTGHLISVYSIPFGKVLVNLKPGYTINVFSPDSRWLAQLGGAGRLNVVDLGTGLMDSVVLKFSSWQSNTVAFTADSRRLIVGSGQGGSTIMDVASKKIMQEAGDRNYFVAADGLKYGVVNQKEKMATIYSSKDSSRLYSLSLAEKKNSKGNDKNENKNSNKNKKGNKQEEATGEQVSIPWQISFGQRSDAFAIWRGGQVIFMRDINKPADTVMYAGDFEHAISKVTISANNNYLNVLPQGGANIIVNLRNLEQSFQPIIPKEKEEFNFATMFRSVLSGNLESILRGRDMAQFSVTGDSVLAWEEGGGYVFDCASGNKLYNFRSDGEIKYCSWAQNLVISSYYGQLKFDTLSNRKAWFSMIPFTNGEMVYLLPNDTYFGSKASSRYLGYMQDAKSLSYKQFDLNNNRPDIVLRALGNSDVEHLALYDSILALRRRREGLREVSSAVTARAPQLSIANEKSIAGEVKQKVLPLQLNIKTYQFAPDRLALYINGNPLGSPKGIRLSHKSNSIDTTVQVTLTQGNNHIEVSVFDASGAESFRQPLFVEYAPDSSVSRQLYFMGIGAAKYQSSGHNLVYAQKDVHDVLDSLKKQYGAGIVVDTFFNQQVTLENLRKLKSKFSKTKPDDIVVVYYSGHGIMDGLRSEAYFGTYDVDFNSPSKRGISIDDFQQLLDNIPSRNKVVFLDACHSGELNKEEGNTLRRPGATDPFDQVLELFTDHYQGNGTNVIVAARGKEVAKECESIHLGVFTYTVLKGLAAMRADEDSNAVLTIGELQNYVTRYVMANSAICRPKVVQRAAIRQENEYNDWAVLRNGKAGYGLRCTIDETTQPRPLVNRAQDTRDSVVAVKKKVDVLTNRNSSLEEKGKALGDIIKIKNPFAKKDNAAWLEDYQKQKNKNAQVLEKADGFEFSYEKVKRKDGEYIVFNIKSKYLIPTLRVDVNANKELDACADRAYTAQGAGDVMEANYLLTAPACEGQAITSGAAMYATGDQYLFMVPVTELSSAPGTAQVNIILRSNQGKDPISWPQVPAEKIFEKYYDVKW